MQYNHPKPNRQTIRLKDHDYTQGGFYFITICTHNREMLFGKIKSGIMILNNYGEIIYNEWFKTPNMRNNIKMDQFVVMPNHIHGIIEITTRRGVLNTPDNVLNTPDNVSNTPDNVLNTPDNVSNTPDKTKQNNSDKRAYVNTPLRSPSQTIGSIVRGMKSAATKRINELRKTPGTKLWLRNYWEHIVKNENELNNIRQYIQNNPQKWQDDKLNNGVGNIVLEQISQYGDDEEWMI